MMDSLLLYKILKNRTGAEISASGNPATLPGTLKNNPMNEMKVYGWSKQETTTGAQLFPTITPSTEVKSGITVEYMEHGKIHISGTSEKTVDFMTPTFELLAGTYTLSMGVNIDNTLMRCTLSTTEGLPYFDILDNGASKTETTGDNKILYLLLRVYGGKTIDITIQPMLNTGTSPLPWEPYTGGQPSPSPDYPQEIVSAGSDGKINLEVHGKNLFNITTESKCDKSGASSTKRIILPGEYIIGLTYTNICANYLNNVFISQERISFFSDGVGYGIGIGVIAEKGKKYVISGEFKNGDVRMVFYDKSGGIMWNTDDNPFVVPEGTKYAVLLLRKSKNTTDEVVFKNIQVEEAISPTAYEPYHTPQSLSISTPTGLPAIPVDSDGNYTDANGQQWIADYVDLKLGKLYKKVTRLNLKDVDAISIAHGFHSNGNGYLSFSVKNISKEHQPISNRYGGSEWTQTSGHTYIPNSNTIVFVDDRFTDKQTAIKLVQDTYVIYALTSQIETDLTPEEIQAYKNLVTYVGTTIVENDAECYMEVSAGGGDSLRAKKLTLILGE